LVRRESLRIVRKFHTRIVFVDHLHYLIDLARVRNPSIEIGSDYSTAENVGRAREFLIFLLCHTTKGASEPNLSYESIRDSSFVAQEADSVLMIKRTPKDGRTRQGYGSSSTDEQGFSENLVHLMKVNDKLGECASPTPGRQGECKMDTITHEMVRKFYNSSQWKRVRLCSSEGIRCVNLPDE